MIQERVDNTLITNSTNSGALEKSYGILGMTFFVPTTVLYTMGWLKLRSISKYDQKATSLMLGRKHD